MNIVSMKLLSGGMWCSVVVYLLVDRLMLSSVMLLVIVFVNMWLWLMYVYVLR